MKKYVKNIKLISKFILALIIVFGLIYSLENNKMNLCGLFLGISLIWYIIDFYKRQYEELKNGKYDNY